MGSSSFLQVQAEERPTLTLSFCRSFVVLVACAQGHIWILWWLPLPRGISCFMVSRWHINSERMPGRIFFLSASTSSCLVNRRQAIFPCIVRISWWQHKQFSFLIGLFCREITSLLLCYCLFNVYCLIYSQKSVFVPSAVSGASNSNMQVIQKMKGLGEKRTETKKRSLNSWLNIWIFFSDTLENFLTPILCSGIT